MKCSVTTESITLTHLPVYCVVELGTVIPVVVTPGAAVVVDTPTVVSVGTVPVVVVVVVIPVMLLNCKLKMLNGQKFGSTTGRDCGPQN